MNDAFTPSEVAALDAYQRSRYSHPFTCPNRGDGNHRENYGGRDTGCLVPTVRGWICQFCDYTQDWAHQFMKGKP